MRKILVTRPVHQSENLCMLIEKQGWQAIRFPVIDIQPRVLSTLEECHVQHISQYQYLFFVSANAVNFALKLFNGKIDKLLHKGLCIAVGTATYKALSDSGINNILLSSQGSDTEAMLAMPQLQILHEQSCLIIRGEGGRELLAQSLRDRGATVDYLEVYKRLKPCNDTQVIEIYLRDKSLSSIVIYSGDALKNLVSMFDKQDIRECLLNVHLVVISKRVYKIAKKIGFMNIFIADHASDSAMINALLNGEECGGNN